MLDIRDFEIHRGNYGKSTIKQDVLFYAGINHHYGIWYDQEFRCYELIVETLDENGEYTDEKKYGCSQLSTAIASIEALENGEEI